MLTKLTKDDFVVLKSEGTYGPIWEVTPKDPGNEWNKTGYVLRSDVKMDKSFYADPSRSTPGVHLTVSYRPGSYGDWKGRYETADMDEAFQGLIDDLNRNNQLDVIERSIEGAISELSEQLDELNRSAVAFARQDIEEAMDNVVVAFNNLLLRYKEVTKEMNDLGW